MPTWPLLAGVLLLGVLTQSALDGRIDAAVERLRPEVPGLAMAIGSGADIVLTRAAGSASTAGAPAIQPDTKFRIASVSKPITAVAVWQLVQQKRVELDKPARDYCAALVPLNAAPTVRHFLAHQSGMRHTTDPEDETIKGAPANFAASLATIVHEPLRFQPGQRTLYTSWGYTVLGCVIESVSGLTYADYVRRNVFERAGMTNTTFDAPDFAAPEFTQGFRRRGNAFEPSVIVDTRFKTPASGVISTAPDLVRFGLSLMNGTLLDAELFKQMLTGPPTADRETTIFTTGWTIGPSNLGTPGFAYNGSMEGTTAFLGIFPERKVAVSVLTNRERFVPGIMPLARETMRAALGLPAAQ